MIADVINPFDTEVLRLQAEHAQPFPFFVLDNFLDAEFARQVEAAFPPFEQAQQMGRQFRAVNERRKVQITDSSLFPAPLLKLHEALASPGWRASLSQIMGIPKLIEDPDLVGGGIHETGPQGHLDVHVDFNYIESRRLHRRLNILVYFNREWAPEWGGNIELWDRDVHHCHHSFSPQFNRCVVFETSEISYHGVSAVRCPADRVRKSFAGYYYTREAPRQWSGHAHSTVFKARPSEKLKGLVLMPAERAANNLRAGVRRLQAGLFGTQ